MSGNGATLFLAGMVIRNRVKLFLAGMVTLVVSQEPSLEW
jgi:hypothetical protein